MNSKEALAYLKSVAIAVTSDRPMVQEAIACLETLEATATDLARLHETDAVRYESAIKVLRDLVALAEPDGSTAVKDACEIAKELF
jgi:hypothetical protein